MKTITNSFFVLTIAFCFVIGAGQDEAFGQRKRGKRGGKSVSQKSVKRNSRPRTKQTPQLGNKKNKSLQGKIRPYKSNQPGLRQAKRKGINGGSQFVQPPSLNNLSGDRNLNRMGDMQMSKQELSGAATSSNQRRTKMGQSVTLTGSTVSGNMAANDLYKVRQNPKGNRQSANLFTRPSDLPQSNGFDIYDAPIRNQQQHDGSRQEFDIYDSPLNSKTALQSVFTNNENMGPKASLNQTRPQNAANPTTGVTISGGDLTGNMNTISGHASTRNMMDKSSTTLAVGEQAGSNGLFTRPSAWPEKNGFEINDAPRINKQQTGHGTAQGFNIYDAPVQNRIPAGSSHPGFDGSDVGLGTYGHRSNAARVTIPAGQTTSPAIQQNNLTDRGTVYLSQDPNGSNGFENKAGGPYWSSHSTRNFNIGMPPSLKGK